MHTIVPHMPPSQMPEQQSSGFWQTSPSGMQSPVAKHLSTPADVGKQYC
jgi:hypothetical protein